MLIKNIFGKSTNKKAVKNQPMIYTRHDGTVVTIPVSAMKKTGFLKDSVSRRIESDDLQDIAWLNNHYEITFERDGDAVAVNVNEGGVQ